MTVSQNLLALLSGGLKGMETRKKESDLAEQDAAQLAFENDIKRREAAISEGYFGLQQGDRARNAQEGLDLSAASKPVMDAWRAGIADIKARSGDDVDAYLAEALALFNSDPAFATYLPKGTLSGLGMLQKRIDAKSRGSQGVGGGKWQNNVLPGVGLIRSNPATGEKELLFAAPSLNGLSKQELFVKFFSVTKDEEEAAALVEKWYAPQGGESSTGLTAEEQARMDALLGLGGSGAGTGVAPPSSPRSLFSGVGGPRSYNMGAGPFNPILNKYTIRPFQR